MECYEGLLVIKTFRGQIATGGVDTIVLHTNNGSIGYRIVKLQVIPFIPENVNEENTLQIFTVESNALTAAGNGEINFSDNTLLAVSYYSSATGTAAAPEDMTVIFDNTIFNQDIYVGSKSSANMNYYLELEQVKLDMNEMTVATLRNIRAERPTTEGTP